MNTDQTNSAEVAATGQIAQYLECIAHLDMPLSAKIEMVSAMRQIMASFVDSAFGDDPIQHVHETRSRDAVRKSIMVGSDKPKTDDKTLSSKFAPPAAGRGRKGRT